MNRDENVQIRVFDAKKLRVVKDVDISLRDGSDIYGMKSYSPILRNETTDKSGAFKFMRLKQSIYSFYANKEDYFEDAFSIPVLGKNTALPIPHLFMIPREDSSRQ